MISTMKLAAICTLCLLGVFSNLAASPPRKGDVAPNFTLKTLDEKAVELQTLTSTGRVVLVVLRGWPGYHCPLCQRQVHEFITHASDLKPRGVQVLFVYPGPAAELKAHAMEFLQDKTWPAEFLFVTDPDYSFTKRYGLRWEAPKETAYPSTFVIDRGGKIRFAHVSKEHGDRVTVSTLLKQL